VNDLVGTRVAGRFRITRRLGEGGMATVWVAAQDTEPREVAVKIMSAALTSDPRFVKRFAREAKAAARVQHPNTVRILDTGSSDGLSYIAMELVVGSDLQATLDRDGPMSQRRAAWMMAEVCDALVTAHDLGVVHRDLKPENVMVVPDTSQPRGERIKVLDFGIAKMLFEEGTSEDPPDSDEQPTALTRAGTQLGTPAYMSPEQCQLLEVDARSDVYTVGILLYQMMSGGVPFEGDTPLHTASLHIHEPLVKPSAYAPHLDERLEAVIVKALAKKPADRHQSAAELGKALRDLVAVLPDKPARLGGPARRRSNPGRSVPPPAAGNAPSTPPPAQFQTAKRPPPRPAAGGAVSPAAASPLPQFGRPPPPARAIADDDSDDDARTLMRDPDAADDDLDAGMRTVAMPDALGAIAATDGGSGRRGTEMLDFNAPVASPSAPVVLRRPMAEAYPPPPAPMFQHASPVIEAAAPRRRAAQRSGVVVMLLGFVAGLALIGVALAAYLVMR
jgi:serine/threonine-protein kinase